MFARILRVFFLLLMAVVCVVLLIACTNVAGLLLARASARRAELAIRLACGASRGRIVRQLLVESLVLAVLGGVCGLFLSLWPMRLLTVFSWAHGPTGTPVFLDVQLDARVFAFTAVATLLTTVVFGLTPAMHATRVDLVSSLKDSAGSFSRARTRLRSALMVGQVTLSCVLLLAAALLVQSLRNTGRVDYGFEPKDVVVSSFDHRTLGYAPARVDAFYTGLLQRARALPGVEQAALTASFPSAMTLARATSRRRTSHDGAAR